MRRDAAKVLEVKIHDEAPTWDDVRQHFDAKATMLSFPAAARRRYGYYQRRLRR